MKRRKRSKEAQKFQEHCGDIKEQGIMIGKQKNVNNIF